MKLAISSLSVAITIAVVLTFGRTEMWTAEELATLSELSLDALEPLPADPSNRYADNPAAAALGEKIFFDTRFSSNGKVSCATCHEPDKHFQDDKPLADGVGKTNRRTMPIEGTQYSPWQFWDGRKDSQWSQALGPLESPVEHGGSRGQYVMVVADHYDVEYSNIFGGDYSDTARVFANIGKAIAAFERTLQPAASRFDHYVKTGAGLSRDEIAGLKLFIGKAQCTQCHNGPLLTDNSFHNIGLASTDRGRAAGAQQVLADEFNCLSKYSDARPEQCAELEFLLAEGEELEGAFKTPSLRGAAARSPYMHAGQLETLGEVVEHYNSAPDATIGHSELEPLKLSAKEREQLIKFLRALDPVKNQR